jgi:xanthine dehydrogenase YagT iron-sulfur-binding subunit
MDMTTRTFATSGPDASGPPAGGCCEGHPALSRRDVLHLAAAVPLATTPLDATANTAAPALPTSQLGITVNGTPHVLEIDNRASLLDVLRETLGLTGTKKGCNQGACGACTVLVGGRRVVACLTLAALQDGARVQTIEGLAQGDRLHPLQAAFVEHEGLQCGFCTAGQIMSGVACIAEGHAGSPEEIRFWMSGNICRCGAYPGIVAAVSDAAGRA